MADAIDAIEETGASSSPAHSIEISRQPAIASDSVELSIPFQVNLLAQQGISVGEIATELGLPRDEVLEDLNIVAVGASAALSEL